MYIYIYICIYEGLLFEGVLFEALLLVSLNTFWGGLLAEFPLWE